MSHFVVFPLSEDGTFYNPALVSQALDDAMSSAFDFDDVFIYSHGWWTTGNDAMAEYGRYTVGFAKNLLSLGNPMPKSLGIGIHWPSTLSEDKVSIQSAFQALSFYQMGSRANQVGANGLFAILRRMLRARQENGNNKPFQRLMLVGHSFGCRVVCRALQQLWQDMKKSATPEIHSAFVNQTEIRAVLLQAAFTNNEFDPGGKYDELINFPRLKILVTTSKEDRALNDLYPKAEKLNNIAHPNFTGVCALGAGISNNPQNPEGGPTKNTITQYNAFNSGRPIQVSVGFSYTDVPELSSSTRMLVADLTPLHTARHTSGAYEQWDNNSGSHSDISNIEIYNLIAGFILRST